MKKIIIGTIVGAIIYFAFQTLMWMGGFHKDFYSYAARQDTILKVLSSTLPEEGLYMMPMADNKSPDFKNQQELLEKTMPGNPWAMIFYHPKMSEFNGMLILNGFILTLISVLMAVLIVYFGRYNGFTPRFLVSMAIALFSIFGIFENMNWWSYPWSFVRVEMMDLFFGWILVSIWLGWYLKRKVETGE